MKTVFDRISKEAMDAFMDGTTIYPSTRAVVLYELKNNNYFTQVKYGVAMNFKFYSGFELIDAVGNINEQETREEGMAIEMGVERECGQCEGVGKY